MTSTVLYNGLNPGGGVVEANYGEDLFLETGEDTYENVVFAAGQQLRPGAVVGMVDATGQVKLIDSAAADGSQDPYGVVVHPVDTTSGADEMSILVKSTRRLNANALSYGTGYTMLTIRKKLSVRGISIRTPGYSG